LWGSHFDAQAEQNLRQALFRLRKLLGQDALEGDGEVVSLNAAVIQCDVGRFEALVRKLPMRSSKVSFRTNESRSLSIARTVRVLSE